ncbi:unnamed protein product [Urochloa decumbens]|uniref:Uncharacterized protein n=1 Tax=Urochloa decumbens TaxID=240449 RepID=A0ABC9C3Z1_9POAL
MAQEKRTLSDAELSFVKFLLDGIPILEAAAGARGGEHSPPRWGFMVAAPVRLAWMRRRSAEGRGAATRRSPSSPSTEEPGPLTPALQLEIAKEVVGRLNSLVKFLEDRVPGLKADSGGVCGGGAARSPSKAAPSVCARARAPAKASRAVAVRSSPVPTLCRLGQVAAPAAANVAVGQQVVTTRHSGEEDDHATSAVVHDNISEHNVRQEHHAGQEFPSEHESLSSASSTKEHLSPALQLEIAKEVITRLTMSQEMGTLSADEHSLVKFMKARISGLGAEAALGVCGGGATPPPPNVAPSDPAHVLAEASHPVAASPSPVPTPLHPPSHQVPTLAAAHVTVGQRVVTEHSGMEDAHATSRVPNKMSEANANHKHHGGKELPSEHESLPSSSPSSRQEPLTPADQLAVANVLITQFAMAQEKRMLSDDELCLVKFLLDRIPVLEATLRDSGGQLSLRRGFMVAPPVQWAWPHRANIGRRAVPCHRPSSSEEPLAPEIQLEIASEVITHLAVEQETRMLSAGELTLIMFLKDRIPDLEAVVRGGATPFPSKVAPSHSRARAKALLAIATILSPAAADLLYPGLSALMVHPLSHQDSTPAAHVTVGQQVVNKHLDEEDAHSTSVVVSGSSLSPSSSSKEPLTPEIQLEIAKEVISQLVKAQEKRMLSAAEHSLIKFLEGRIPGLEAVLGVCNGETHSLSKVASSCLVRAKAQRVIMATFSAVDQGCPVPFAPMVHPLSQQDATPAAHVTVGRQVVTRHSGEEDAHATSAVHKMSDANVSHEHHRGQELSSEHESFSEKLNSGCDLGVITEKSSTTIAPEMAPPSDGDNTAESSGVSNRWGTAPDVEGFDDFGLPDDLGLY